MAGNSAIWRDGTEAAATTDKIEFNTGAVVTPGGNIMNTSFNISTGIARNERPGAMDKLQDTGVNGVTITVTGTAEDPEGTGATLGHKLKEWALEAKTVATTFPKGRFGLRLDDFVVFNMTPTTLKGYMLENVDFRRDGETKGKIEFVLTLRFNGDETDDAAGTGTGTEPNASGQYEW